MGKAAENAGHALTVVAPGRAHGVSRHSGMKLVRYPAPPMPYDSTYRVPWRVDLMRRLVAEERPDIVQISSPFAPALAASLLGDAPVRVYFHHSDPIGCYVRPLLERALPTRLADCIEHAAWGWHRRIAAFCDATVVAGHWLEAQLTARGCARVTTVPFGISRSDLGSHCRDEALRARFLGRFASDPRAVLVLISGRLAADKRQALLVDALTVVRRSRPVALVVLGDGPERAALQQRARGLDQVTFLPFTHDRREFAGVLASVDLLLHGSACETYGFVVAETLASGTPVVVPDAGGAGALAHPDYAETYAARADAQGVARAVQRLLARPRLRLAQAALRAAVTFPSSEQHFEHLFALYARLLVERARRRAGEPATGERAQCAATAHPRVVNA
jgi:alpha-1,6-mannosyltransferase